MQINTWRSSDRKTTSWTCSRRFHGGPEYLPGERQLTMFEAQNKDEQCAMSKSSSGGFLTTVNPAHAPRHSKLVNHVTEPYGARETCCRPCPSITSFPLHVSWCASLGLWGRDVRYLPLGGTIDTSNVAIDIRSSPL